MTDFANVATNQQEDVPPVVESVPVARDRETGAALEPEVSEVPVVPEIEQTEEPAEEVVPEAPVEAPIEAPPVEATTTTPAKTLFDRARTVLAEIEAFLNEKEQSHP